MLILQIMFAFDHIMGYNTMEHVNIIVFKISFYLVYFAYLCNIPFYFNKAAVWDILKFIINDL